MSVVVGYRLIAANLERNLAVTANQGPVRNESDYYLANRGSVRSLDDFLADTRLFRFAMTAFGLEDLAFARGYMRKVLEGGVSDPRSLANRTTDVRIREFARAFDFATFGDLTMSRAVTGQAVVDRHVRQTLEVEAGARDGEGVRLALYFQRQAATIDDAFDILGDAALSQVVRTALGLPEAIAGVDIDRQAEILNERLDYADFRDPVALDRFLTRFASLWDARNDAVPDPVLALFGGGPSGPAVSIELAMSLSTLRLGGR